MSDEIKPALSAEEWREGTVWLWPNPEQQHVSPYIAFRKQGLVIIDDDYYARTRTDIGERPHALAAICLDGQAFGFTHDDVESLRTAAEEWRNQNDEGWRWAEHLADRIAALLPPTG